MNKLDYVSSSDSDQDTKPTKKVKIMVQNVEDSDYKRTFNPAKRSTLLQMLPKAKEQPKKLGGGNTIGGIAIDLKLNKKNKESAFVEETPEQSEKKVLEKTLEEDDSDFEFFSIPKSPTLELKPVIGDIKGPARPVKIAPKTNMKTVVEDNDLEEFDPYDNSARGPIKVKTIIQRDQVGDAFKKRNLHMKSSVVPSVYDDTFKVKIRLTLNIELDANGSFSRNNNIMSLAQDAKTRFASFEDNRAERKSVQKITRQKYGW